MKKVGVSPSPGVESTEIDPVKKFLACKDVFIVVQIGVEIGPGCSGVL